MEKIVESTHTFQSPSLTRASRTQRFFTFLLDTAFFVPFGIFLGVAFAIVGLDDQIKKAPDFLLGVIIYILYYVCLETYTGRTFGKMIMKTRAVSKDGNALSFGQALARTLCRFLPFEGLSFFGRQESGGPAGWHDRIPKTLVVSTKDVQ